MAPTDVQKIPTGKPQDGWVARHLNRPISHAVTRQLLKFPISPSAWTLIITPLPIVGSMLFLKAEYWPGVAATLLFQLYSILDGCDGEIARAKHLESEAGRQLDMWCDIAASVLLVLSIGHGWSREHGVWHFGEGLAAAGLILGNEAWLAFRARRESGARTDQITAGAYPRHQGLLRDSGMTRMGGRFAFFLVQITKRDVAILFFVFLAAVNRTAWIVHLLFGTAAVTSVLALLAALNRRPITR